MRFKGLLRSRTNAGNKERRVLRIALALNAAMAVIGGLAGWIAQSIGLLADALDMHRGCYGICDRLSRHRTIRQPDCDLLAQA